MATHTFGAYVDIERAPKVAGPAPVVHKFANTVLEAPDTHELDRMTWGTVYNGPPQAEGEMPIALNTPARPGTSRPGSLFLEDHVDIVQSFSSPSINRYRMLSVCLMNFANGFNDSAPGALIPYIEKAYGIGYAVVSLIFVTTALGFISAAFLTDPIHSRFGRAKTLMTAEVVLLAGYLAIAVSPPFPVVVAAFLLVGFGMAVRLSIGNVFVANLADSTATLGAFHGSYGLGGTVGPLIATAMVSHSIRWTHFYFLTLGISALSLVLSGWSFWSYEQDNANSNNSAATQPLHSTSDTLTKRALFRLVVKNRTTLLGALFIFAYQGAEVSISGWVISFLLAYRPGQADPSRVGYVTAGFWAGITLGRFLLSVPFVPKLMRFGGKERERPFVAIVVALAVGAQAIVWRVPNVVGDGVAVSLVGLLLGPVYPCATAVFNRRLGMAGGRRLQMSALGFISATGSAGGAVAPFMTGLGAQAAGTWILHPVAMGLFGLMELSWFFLPDAAKRRE